MKDFREKLEQHEIHFPVRLGGLKRVNDPGENSDIYI